MAVGPMRALLHAHLLATVQQMGRAGRWSGLAFLAFALVALGSLMLPAFVASFLIGSVTGLRLEDPVVTSLVALGLFFVSWGGGFFSAFVTPDEEFGWDAYRHFPIAGWRLYLCELVAGLVSALALMSVAALTGFFVGLGTALGPRSIPLLVVLWLLCILTLLVWRSFVAATGRELLRRLRTPVAVLFILGVGSVSFFLRPLVEDIRKDSPQRSAVLQRLPALTPWLPGATTLEVVRSAHAGAGRPTRALAFGIYGLAGALVVGLLGYGLARVERGAPRAQGGGGSSLPWGWGMTSRVASVARVHWATLFGSRQGKALFANFALVFLLCRDRQSFSGAEGQWLALSMLAARFTYVALIASQLHFNLFGLDRHGIKTLFLLPIDDEELLRGKIRALWLFQAFPALVIAVLLRVVDGYPYALIAAGLCFWLCLGLAVSLVGAWFSSWRPIPFRDRRGNLETFIASGVLLFLLTASLGVGFVLVGHAFPSALLPGMAVLAVAFVALHEALLPRAAKYLRQRREVILERIGG